MSVRRAFWLCSYTGKTYIFLEFALWLFRQLLHIVTFVLVYSVDHHERIPTVESYLWSLQPGLWLQQLPALVDAQYNIKIGW